MEAGERLRRYRRYVYEAGAISRPDKPQTRKIGDDILEKERASNFDLGRIQRFRQRTRYFTDSGIIGTKAIVSAHFQQFKHVFSCKNDKIRFLLRSSEGWSGREDLNLRPLEPHSRESVFSILPKSFKHLKLLRHRRINNRNNRNNRNKINNSWHKWSQRQMVE
jgi:hypothetical protein